MNNSKCKRKFTLDEVKSQICCFLLGLQEFRVCLHNLKRQPTSTHEAVTTDSSADQPSSLDWSLHLHTESYTGGYSGEPHTWKSGGNRMEQRDHWYCKAFVTVGKETFPSILWGYLVCIWKLKWDRLTTERHRNLSDACFVWYGGFH